METSNFAMLTKRIYESPFTLFTTKTLRDLSGTDLPQPTFFALLARLTQQHILQKIERDKYILAGAKIHDFRIANFLYEPSYVSLESALNFHNVLSQFPYEVASVTPKKPVTKSLNGKTFRYVHMKQTLFWGYEAVHGFLIAQPEKALLDLLYFQSKGLAILHMDELDWSRLDKARLLEWIKRFPPMKGIQFP